jgi:hypothetical protein
LRSIGTMALSDSLKSVYQRIFYKQCPICKKYHPKHELCETCGGSYSENCRDKCDLHNHSHMSETYQAYRQESPLCPTCNDRGSTTSQTQYGLLNSPKYQCDGCGKYYETLVPCETCGGFYCENCLGRYDLHEPGHWCDICQTYHQETSLCAVCNAHCCTTCRTQYDLHGPMHQCNGCGEFSEILVYCEVCKAYYCFRCSSDYALHVEKHQCDRCGESVAVLKSIDGKRVCSHCFTVLLRASIGSAKTGKVISTGDGGARHPSFK